VYVNIFSRRSLSVRCILTGAASSNKTFAYDFADKPTASDMKSEVLIAHVL